MGRILLHPARLQERVAAHRAEQEALASSIQSLAGPAATPDEAARHLEQARELLRRTPCTLCRLGGGQGCDGGC